MSDGPELRVDWRSIPDPRRLAPTHRRYDDIVERHRRAVDAGLPTYIDPDSGFSVFTAVFLERRSYCCESGCRHCPYT